MRFDFTDEALAESLAAYLHSRFARVLDGDPTLHEAAATLAPAEDELVDAVLASGLLHADETSWPERGQPLWLWVFTAATVTLYYVAGRGKELVENVLEGFTGWLMSDGWGSYRHDPRRLRCWAHLRRKAQGARPGRNRTPADQQRRGAGAAALGDCPQDQPRHPHCHRLAGLRSAGQRHRHLPATRPLALALHCSGHRRPARRPPPRTPAAARGVNDYKSPKDDVESSLLLLSYLDADLAAHGVTWFKRNILDLTAKSARELIRGRSGKRAQVDYDRLCAYHIFAGLD